MKEGELVVFEEFLREFKKKSGKAIGERTIHGIITLAKFIAPSKANEPLEILQNRYKNYLTERNHQISKYALWLYLKSKEYDERFLKEIISFSQRNKTAITDAEKLASYVLTKKELFYLVKSISNLRDKLLVKLLYDTGARVSEITSLTLKDIEMEDKEVKLMGKGRKPRTVYFHKSTEELLNNYLNENKIENPNSKVFNITPMTVWYNLKKYGEEILNRKLHPHMFRHTRLQHMADEGVDSYLIKSYAGHSDLNTGQIYIRSSKYQAKMAFERAGDIWTK